MITKDEKKDVAKEEEKKEGYREAGVRTHKGWEKKRTKGAGEML